MSRQSRREKRELKALRDKSLPRKAEEAVAPIDKGRRRRKKLSESEEIAAKMAVAQEQAHRNELRRVVEEALEGHSYCISITKVTPAEGDDFEQSTVTYMSGKYLDPWFPTHHRHIRDNLSKEKNRRDKERVGMKEKEDNGREDV